MNAAESLKFFLPELFLLGGSFLCLASDLFFRSKRPIVLLAFLTLAGTFLLAKFRVPVQSLALFEGSFRFDKLTRFAGYLMPFVTFLVLLMSLRYRELERRYEGEYYTLFLLMTFALILVSAASTLLMIFLSIEFVSLLSYLMTGLLKKDARSKEAAVKYLLFGSTASAIMLYGMSIFYGITGSLEITSLMMQAGQSSHSFLIALSLVLFLTGLGFKISMAPFHFWAPDVYEAAPTPVTAFLTVAPKAAGFLVLIRVLGMGYGPWIEHWRPLIAALSILTMTWGNLSAIAQSNIKRLLAFSSIAQAGYLLMAVAVFDQLGIQSLLLYLAAYAWMNLGAFAVVIAVSNTGCGDQLSAYTGLAKRAPWLAAVLTICLVSLAGIPPLVGFIGKLFLFSAVVRGGFFALAVSAALNSAVAAFYYFKIVRAMYLTAPDQTDPITVPLSLKLALVTTLAGVLVLGIFPGHLIAFIQSTIS